MMGLGIGEILLIAIVVLIVVGPEQLPQFMRTAGRYYGWLRRASDELRNAFTVEADRIEAEERYQKLQERRKAAEEARKKAAEATPGVVPASHPALPPPPPTPTAPVAPSPTALPAGVSQEEWDQLPPHIRELLQKRTGS